MERYDQYKDSRVEWIGEIPRHWEVSRIKYLTDGSRDSFIDGDWIESKDISESGIRYITTGNIGEGYYKEQGSGYITEETFQRLNCSEIKEGDLIISRLSIPVGRSCILPLIHSKVVTSVDNVILRPENKHNKYFLNYQFNCRKYFEFTELISRGTTLTRISRGMLGNNPIVLPPQTEQHQIVSYLDQKTSLIDSLIEKTQRKIELLKEKRTSLINEVVTKGLNPDVEMKDSGVEWIGMIPRHWTIQPIKYLKSEIKDSIVDGPFGSSVNVNTDYGDYEIPVIRTTNITDKGFDDRELKFMRREKYEELIRHNVLPNDVLFSKVGTIGNVCLFPENYKEGILSTTGSCRIRLDETKVDRNWFVYIILKHKKEFLFLSGQNVQPFLNMTTIKDVKLEVPPLVEQKQIVVYLDEQTSLIDKTKSIEERRIELLKEYRQSLISEVVTGKRKVITDE